MNSTRTLFILDDDCLVSSTLERFSQASGYNAARFDHASPFLNAVHAAPPQVIVLDLFLPEIDGLEILQRLADIRCKSKIILISGAEEKILSAACRLADNLGLHLLGCLAKPFSLYKFRKTLKVNNNPTDCTVTNITNNPSLTLALLKHAIADDKIETYYQPKLTAIDGRLAGFEVLARWEDENVGFISPERFIVLAEQNSLINALSHNVFKRSLAWFNSLTRTFYRHYPRREKEARLTLSLNISATSLSSSHFFNTLEKMCAEIGVSPTDIILEITETGAMADSVTSLRQLTRLRMKGFTLSIDDFGTGFSSMQHLVTMPFSELKIDKGFVLNLEKSSQNHKAVKGIIKLAHSLGVHVTAEGVENEAIWSMLHKLGCDFVQGFYFGKPMSAEQVSRWLIHSSQSFTNQ